MNKEKAFGIGCYHFGVKKTPPFKFKGTEYLEELKLTLSSISNLNNLKISSDEDFNKWTTKITEELPNLEDDDDFFPYPFKLNIDFELYIPFRIQEEITGEKEKFLDTYGENFKVKIIQSFDLPVAVVEIINPTKKPDPSTAVQIVREFIRRELTKNKSQYIRFEYLGPSPFHLDCYLKPQKPKSDEEWLFNPQEQLRKGYDELTIYYNEDNIKDSDEAMDYLISSLRDEFGFFYRCIQMRNSKMHSWDIIEKNLNELLEIQNKYGLKGFYKRFFRRPSLIGQLFTDIATFEGEDIFRTGLKQNSYNKIFSIKDQIFFKTFIDKELEEKIDYPVKQTSDLITFFEIRRVKSMEFIIALISAILGGAIGAILTIYFLGGQ